MVDLDGAFAGASANLDAVRSILQSRGTEGSVRWRNERRNGHRKSIGIGLRRVIIGTRACEEPEWIGSLLEKFGAEKIVVGIDAKDGLVATKGWVETTETEAVELAKNLQSMGLRWIIHTDVATDGAMKGPNLEAQKKMADAVPECQVIASGGVTRENDVDDLRSLVNRSPESRGSHHRQSLVRRNGPPAKPLLGSVNRERHHHFLQADFAPFSTNRTCKEEERTFDSINLFLIIPTLLFAKP